MSLLPLYYQLFRFLFCPSRLLCFIVCTALVSVLGGLVLLGVGIAAGWLTFILGATLLTMVLGFMLSVQLPLLISRKTLVFSGAISIHIGILIYVVLAMIALLIANVAQVPTQNTAEYARWVLLCFSGLLLATVISALTRFGLFIIGFAFGLLAITEPAFTVLASWPVINHPGLYVLAAVTVSGSWVFLYRLYRGRLIPPPRTYSGNFNRHRCDSSVYTKLSELASRALYSRKLTKASVLLFEPTGWPLMVLVSMTIFGFLALMVGAGVMKSLALGIFSMTALLTFIGLTAVPVNMRRLWLIMSGDRAEQFRYMERQMFKLVAFFLLPGIATATVLLWLGDENKLWLAAYMLLVVMLAANYAYFAALTATYGASAFAVVAALLFWIPGYIGWFLLGSATLVTVAGVLVMALFVIRYLAYRYWLDVDLSRLRKHHSSWSW